MQNTYRLAGHAIEIKSIYKEVHMFQLKTIRTHIWKR